MSQVAQMQDAMTQMITNQSQLMQRLNDAEKKAKESELRANAAVAGNKKQLVDTRAFGKATGFHGDRKKWMDWSFSFKAFLAGANATTRKALEWAAQQEEEITPEMMELEDVEYNDLAEQVYLALSLQLKNDALVKVRSTEDGNGLEVWRKLTLEYEPRNKGRQRVRLQKLLRPDKRESFGKTVACIEKWEREVKDYESNFKKSIDADIKIGVLSYLAPPKVEEHLHLHADKYENYADARKLIVD